MDLASCPGDVGEGRERGGKGRRGRKERIGNGRATILHVICVANVPTYCTALQDSGVAGVLF